MTSHLVTGIGELVTHDPRFTGPLLDAALVAEHGVVVWVGPARHAPATDTHIDLGGAAVVPGFVDSHTHLVFAGDRAAEFEARMAGTTYTGGGIATTVAATRAASEDDLRRRLAALVTEARSQGTTTIEVKSGYGLDVETEERLLRLAREVTTETTFLGAHVVPHGVDADDYVALVCGPMLDACAPSARWIDVFCEEGAFDADQSRAVLEAGRAAGLGLRIHANQLGHGPGVQLGVALGVASADHCTYLGDDDLEALAASDTVATFLPATDFSTRQPYPDARRAIDAGVSVAIATNCNPGSSYTTSMAFCIALAVRDMRMTAEEALVAATLGGARALRRSDIGHLGIGARADAVLLDAPSYAHLVYRPGVPLVATTFVRGRAAAA